MQASAFTKETVALMRADPATLGADPEHALRLTLRLLAGFGSLQGQLRLRLALGSTELQALMALWDGGRCTMSELGERIGLSRAAITTLSDRLEARQHILRLPDPNDRRRILVSITPVFEGVLFEQMRGMERDLAAIATGDPHAWQTFASVAADVRRAAADQARALHELKPIVSRKPRRAKQEVDGAHW